MQRVALLTLTAISAWAAVGLWWETRMGEPGQVVLGLLTAGILAGLLVLQPVTVRWQALGVVAVATFGEVVASLLWGLYEYRLGNLPPFVPPGHALVYLAGLSLATLLRARVALATGAAAAVVWGVAGLTVLPATDLAGALGCAFLVVVLARTRRPVYAGVFLFVAALEFYGTALGTWSWASTVPGLQLSQGNPPSGVACGYVIFELCAIWLVARLRLARSPAVPAPATP